MAFGTSNVKRYFETAHVDLTTAGTAYKILDLRTGEAVIIKALVGNTGNVYVGQENLTSSTGFELAPGESIKISLSDFKDIDETLTIYGTSATSGDDVCYIMVP